MQQHFDFRFLPIKAFLFVADAFDFCMGDLDDLIFSECAGGARVSPAITTPSAAASVSTAARASGLPQEKRLQERRKSDRRFCRDGLRIRIRW